jgi:catechol 2,3-dioxygenase-like lactoylglutathione lyase family enzyme
MGLSGMGNAQEVEPARFHHVHLNCTDVARSMQHYKETFGGVPVKFMGRADAVFTERSFLLFNPVDTPPNSALDTGIWHIGWGGVDVANEYEWLKKKGARFHTPLSPLPGPDNYYMYLSGPDNELIEINTMGHHRFAHVHLFATDVNAVTNWYTDHLGVKSRRGREVPKPTGNMNTLEGIWMNMFQCDNVLFIVFGKPDVDPPPRWWPDPPLKSIQPTKGRPIDHLAFSYRSIGPVYERMKKAGLTIVQEIATDERYGLKSFFVLGPEQVLIEIVESKPIPEGIWE